MKEVGPEHYRALHLVDGDGCGPGRRGVNPSSPIAVLLASLVVSAHGGADQRPSAAAATNLSRSQGDTQGMRALATVDALRLRWQRAIGHDDTVQLGALIVDHPQMGLALMTAENGKSALMVAAKADDLPLVQALVDVGASIDARTATGGTAMMFAALGEELHVARWLLERGASLDEVGSNGWTALTIAAARGFEPMVDWLLDSGADPNPVDIYGFTPLMRSVENGHGEVVLRLLAADGIAVDQADESGNTALHHAAAAQRHDLVEALLEAGADRAVVNDGGYSAPELIGAGSLLQGLFAGAG